MDRKALRREERRAELEAEREREEQAREERRSCGFYVQVEAATSFEELKSVLLEMADRLDGN